MNDIKDLKSNAYDLISQIEWAQNQLRKTNEEIAKLLQQIKEKDNGSIEHTIID